MNEETLQLLFQGIDDGLSDLFASVQSQLANLLAMAGGQDMALFNADNVQQYADALSSASDSAQQYVSSATAVADATEEQQAAVQAASDMLQESAQSTEAAASQSDAFTSILSSLADAIRANTAAVSANNDALVENTSSLDATTASLDKVAAGHGSARQGAQQHTESSQALSEAQSGLNEILGLTGINLSGLGEHFSQIGEGLSGLTGEAAESSIALDALGAGVAGLAAGAIVASTESFVELSDQVREFSEQTGLTQPTVQALMLGMNELGLSSDTAGRAFIQMDTNTQRLADSLAKGKVPTDSFTSGLQALHINLQQFVQEAPDQQLATLMDAFQRLGDSTQTTALAADVFGRRIGPELIPFLVQGSGALDELKGKIDQAGSSVADSQDKVLAWHTALADLQNSLQGLENEIGGPTITALSSLVNKVNEAVQAAKLLSDALGGWADKIGGIGTVVQFLLNPVQGLADKLTFLPGPLQEVLHQVTGILNPLTDAKDAFGLLGDALDKVTGKHQQHAQAARDDAAATQDAGTAADTAAAQVAEEEAALNLGTQSAAQLAQAHQLLSQMEQESNKSASDAAVVRQAEADAIRWVATSGDAGYAALQQLADVQKNSADPAAQQLAKDTSDFVTILRSGLIPGALDTTTAAQGLDQALQGVATSARSTQSASDIAKVTLADLDEQFQTGAIDASTYADKLAQLITKPSAAMLALQAQVSQNTATIKAWDAQVADASPIEQRIAALQKQLDQEQATGASQQQVARTQAELTANIQADTSGLGENVAAGQHNIDMLQNTVRADQARYDAMSASNRAQADQITAAHNGALSQQDIANAVANYDRTVQPATQHTQDFAAAAQNVDGRIRDANGDLPAMKTNIDLLGIAADVAAGKFNALAGAIQTGVASAANALDRALQAAGAAQGGATGAALGAGSGSYPSAAGTLSMPQIVQGLTAAGVPHGSVAQLAAVIMAESGGSTTAGSAAGAYGLGQFMPGTWSGIGMPGTAESADLPTTFQAIARLWSQQGLAPWDAYSYVAGNGPYGEQYVGPGQGSYQQFLPAALAAASGGGNGQLPVPAPDSTRPPAGTTLSAAQQAGITSGDTQQSVTDAYNKALGITPGTATNVTPDQLGQAISQLQADQAKLKDAYDQYEALLNSGDATPAALDAANAAFKEATTAVSNDRTAVQDYSKDLQSYALDGIQAAQQEAAAWQKTNDTLNAFAHQSLPDPTSVWATSTTTLLDNEQRLGTLQTQDYQIQQNLISATSAYTSAVAHLNDIKRTGTADDIAAAQTDVTIAQASMQSAQQVSDAQIQNEQRATQAINQDRQNLQAQRQQLDQMDVDAAATKADNAIAADNRITQGDRSTMLAHVANLQQEGDLDKSYFEQYANDAQVAYGDVELVQADMLAAVLAGDQERYNADLQYLQWLENTYIPQVVSGMDQESQAVKQVIGNINSATTAQNQQTTAVQQTAQAYGQLAGAASGAAAAASSVTVGSGGSGGITMSPFLTDPWTARVIQDYLQLHGWGMGSGVQYPTTIPAAQATPAEQWAAKQALAAASGTPTTPGAPTTPGEIASTSGPGAATYASEYGPGGASGAGVGVTQVNVNIDGRTVATAVSGGMNQNADLSVNWR